METGTTLNNDPRSDTELMEAVRRCESDAIQEIYKRYESGLRIVIQNVLHDDGEIDDALNDVFLQLSERLRRAYSLPKKNFLTNWLR